MTAELLPVAREAVAIARRTVVSSAPTGVREKAARDVVTDVDLAVEDAVREFLARETPHLAFVGEERGRSGPDDAPWWVLDPVDGTSNFARGIPLCGISLGLVEGPTSVLGVIDLPFLDLRYSAARGSGAFVGDTALRASRVTELPQAVVSLGDFAVGEDAHARNRVRLALLEHFGARAQRVRMVGSAAIDLAWVADGRLDAAVMLSNLPWDTAAGVLLVREAGGLVLDAGGADHTVTSPSTVAVCPGLRDAVLDVLREAGT
ncbi:inositol monophosphatase [Actinosynnema pretiosum subsp. pretiosum]|uniref:Inositol-1-monophosphatase n=1 Tax=Actinosynnema pretiosum subsp. pretiosum TaxID=103721 RepID=A0AA45R4Z6_9PSEU|nr:Inositol-1-monophosphatase [Actinosynnema pretiosum subsp. pretiosum]QUF05431.1 inositol monophosphatase [Actinosynnema pretiosum subsp. pretiosum]